MSAPPSTITLMNLRSQLEDLPHGLWHDIYPVYVIVNGVAHSVESVWIEPRQANGKPAVCIGVDPR